MKVLVFDSETTGLTVRGAPAEHSSQPSLVQLGAVLFELETERVRAELNVIVNPEDRFTIPVEASNVHGITTEAAREFGIPLIIALAAFNNLAKAADVFVAHNLEYDDIVMRRAYSIVKKPHLFDERPGFCTMRELTPIMNLPPSPRMLAKGMTKPKPPSLMEAYGFVTGGERFEGAHDAMADVRACGTVFKWLQRRQTALQAAE